MHSTGTQTNAKKHSREGQKQTTGIIFKCLPGQVVLKNQWLRITEKNGKCETGIVPAGDDRRERVCRQEQTNNTRSEEGEKEGRTRVKNWDLQARAILRQSFQDDK